MALATRHQHQGLRPCHAGTKRVPEHPTSRRFQENCEATQSLPGEMGAHWIPLKLVNDIRATVLGWQEDGYQGITQTSRDLINHWTDEEACQTVLRPT